MTSNPYTLLLNWGLPQDCVSYISTFYRPVNPLSESIKNYFFSCYSCGIPLKTKDYKYEVCYSTYTPSCAYCTTEDNMSCKDCIIISKCSCTDSESSSIYSRLST